MQGFKTGNVVIKHKSYTIWKEVSVHVVGKSKAIYMLGLRLSTFFQTSFA